MNQATTQLLCRKAHIEKRAPEMSDLSLLSFLFFKFSNQMCSILKYDFTSVVSVRKREARRQVRSLRLREVRCFVQGQK